MYGLSSLLYSFLPTPAEMRLWDTTAIEHYGYNASMLMETASRGTLHHIVTLPFIDNDSPILIYVGAGNNGGDGIALGRQLHELGYTVHLLITAPPDTLPNPAAMHWKLALHSKIPFSIIPQDNPAFIPFEFGKPTLIIDALLGTGLNRPLSDFLQGIICHINTLHNSSHIIALDIPSGLCGIRGYPLPQAIQAHTTIHFEAIKLGLAFPHAKAFTGKNIVHSIGIPQQIKHDIPSSWRLLEPAKKAFIHLHPHSHKGSAGKVLVIGGSSGMEGAPMLSGLAALRTGSGLVTIACPAHTASRLRNGFPEILIQGIGQDAVWTSSMASELVESIEKSAPQSIVLGMGMGRSVEALSIVETVLSLPGRCPVILDADALFLLALGEEMGKNMCAYLTPEDIITPHPLEAARLLALYFPSCSISKITEYIQENRGDAMHKLCSKYPCVCVLKGAGTLISQQGSPLVLAPYDLPSLAIAGSGDVLAGLIGSLAARSEFSRMFSPMDTASFGVYLHAEAGKLLAEKHPLGHLASEIAHQIPLVLAPHIQSSSL